MKIDDKLVMPNDLVPVAQLFTGEEPMTVKDAIRNVLNKLRDTVDDIRSFGDYLTPAMNDRLTEIYADIAELEKFLSTCGDLRRSQRTRSAPTVRTTLPKC